MRPDARIGLALLALALLPGPAAAGENNPCHGRHGLPRPVLAAMPGGEDGGIGGTGRAPTPVLPPLAHAAGGDEGIGGTGIVGVITGFGSICVGDKEIHYDLATPVRSDTRAVGAQMLALGQMVSVRARALGQEQEFVAAEILVLHEVRGPVEQVAADGTTLRVLGQTVHVAGGGADAAWLGRSLAVSGYRLADGAIFATRIEPGGADGQVVLVGVVDALGERSFTLAGQSVQLAAQGQLPVLGSEVLVAGSLTAGGIVAEAWQGNPRLAYSAPVERIYLQGQVRRVEAGAANLEGLRVNMSEERAARLPAFGERGSAVIRVGEDGRLDMDRWVPERNLVDTRPDQGGAPGFRAMDAAQARPLALPARPNDVGRNESTRPVGRPDFVRPERLDTFSTGNRGTGERPLPPLRPDGRR